MPYARFKRQHGGLHAMLGLVCCNLQHTISKFFSYFPKLARKAVVAKKEAVGSSNALVAAASAQSMAIFAPAPIVRLAGRVQLATGGGGGATKSRAHQTLVGRLQLLLSIGERNNDSAQRQTDSH